MNEIDTELKKLLRSIFDDDEFVTCIFAQLKNEDLRKEMIDYIKQKPQITSEEITLMAIEMKRNNLIK